MLKLLKMNEAEAMLESELLKMNNSLKRKDEEKIINKRKIIYVSNICEELHSDNVSELIQNYHRNVNPKINAFFRTMNTRILLSLLSK